MAELQQVLDCLSDGYVALSPQLKRAAKYILDNPAEVGIRSMRQLASEADVPPSTMTRLSRALAFDSFEAFRQPFREAIRNQAGSYQARARDLQQIAGAECDGRLLTELTTANLTALDRLRASLDPALLDAVATRLIESDRVFVLGLRGCYSLAHYFAYVSRMALPKLNLLGAHAGQPIDEVSGIGPQDTLIAIAFAPYTGETVRTARFARKRGAAVVALTDSRAAPIVPGAAHVLIVPTASPQFFPSAVGAVALLEALIASVVARGGPGVIDSIADTGRLLAAFGVYWDDAEAAGAKGA